MFKSVFRRQVLVFVILILASLALYPAALHQEKNLLYFLLALIVLANLTILWTTR